MRVPLAAYRQWAQPDKLLVAPVSGLASDRKNHNLTHGDAATTTICICRATKCNEPRDSIATTKRNGPSADYFAQTPLFRRVIVAAPGTTTKSEWEPGGIRCRQENHMGVWLFIERLHS